MSPYLCYSSAKQAQAKTKTKTWTSSRTGNKGGKKNCFSEKEEAGVTLSGNKSPAAWDFVKNQTSTYNPTLAMPLLGCRVLLPSRPTAPQYFSPVTHMSQAVCMPAKHNHCTGTWTIRIIPSWRRHQHFTSLKTCDFNVVAKIMHQNDNCDVWYGFAPLPAVPLLSNTSSWDVLLNIHTWIAPWRPEWGFAT